MATVRELLGEAVERLRATSSETPRLDAELLLGRAIGVERTVLIAHPDAPVGADAAADFGADLDRRVRGEPVAYIRGFKEFCGIAFSADSRALIPRPETETLVELAEGEIVARLTAAPRPPGTPAIVVADVGTGCGTIVLALAVRLRRRGALGEVDLLATDTSASALALARENAVGHGVADRVRMVEADLLPPVLDRRIDVLVANLPYIPSDEIGRLPIAASFEPRDALDGGPDGLAVIARLLDRLPTALAGGGLALLEIGSDQADGVGSLVAARLTGWTCRIGLDLAGRPRTARIERALTP